MRKASLGLFGGKPQKKNIVGKLGKDQPSMLLTQHWFWYPEQQEEGSWSG